MKPILLLGPAHPGGPPLERWLVEFRPVPLAEAAAADAAGYSSVIVVNDGGAQTFRRLLTAFEMRERQEHLGIAMLSYLDELDRRLPTLINLEPRLRFELKGDALRLEYQAV
jgi:hypothetical protein